MQNRKFHGHDTHGYSVFEVTRDAASAGERLHRPVIDLVMINRCGT